MTYTYSTKNSGTPDFDPQLHDLCPYPHLEIQHHSRISCHTNSNSSNHPHDENNLKTLGVKITNDSNLYDKGKTKNNIHIHISFQSPSTTHHTIIASTHIITSAPLWPFRILVRNTKRQNRSRKSPKTIKKRGLIERHHTKISFVKTSVPQENTPRKTQRKTPYKKIPCVVPHQLFTNSFRSSITTHCRFPASQSPNAPRRTHVRHC